LVLCMAKNIFTFPGVVGFAGWDMFTSHSPPWDGEDKISRDFNEVNNKFLELVSSNKFKLRFFTADKHEPVYVVESMKWRNYNIFWSVKYAINATGSSQKNFIECGVCDGLSAYYAINASITEMVKDPKFYLYDAWDGMKKEYLTESEKGCIGEYSYLDISITKSNLKEFDDITVFNKGYLPESLESSENPDSAIWMHIDLNSAKPTLSALERFHDRLVPGGVILFDDYAHIPYADTRTVVDKFFTTKKGINFSLPSGQSIYFKLD